MPSRMQNYQKLKSEGVLPDVSFMPAESTGEDPYVTPAVSEKEVKKDLNNKKSIVKNDRRILTMAKKTKKETDEEEVKACNKENSEDDEAKKNVVEQEEEKKGDMDDEEEDEEEKKKKAKKGEGSSLNPEESESQAASTATVTPNMGVPSQSQDVFVPPSSVDGKREQDTTMGKSAEVDMTKSPLFVSITKQLGSLQEAMGKKVDALEKSVNDRLKNIKTDVEKIEKFYSQSFYKATGENVAPEGTQATSISKQIELGQVRYRAK